MRIALLLSFLAILACVLFAQEQAATGQTSPTFREPFTLKLKVDKNHYYEQHFDKIPYVANDDVYLFVDEHFGVNLTDTKGEFLTVTYQPDMGKADVLFGFTQEKADKGMLMMLLTVQNKLNRRISYEALMTVPKTEGILKTSVVPLEAHLTNFESWPHPIVQLELRNFRFSDEGHQGSGSAVPK